MVLIWQSESKSSSLSFYLSPDSAETILSTRCPLWSHLLSSIFTYDRELLEWVRGIITTRIILILPLRYPKYPYPTSHVNTWMIICTFTGQILTRYILNFELKINKYFLIYNFELDGTKIDPWICPFSSLTINKVVMHAKIIPLHTSHYRLCTMLIITNKIMQIFKCQIQNWSLHFFCFPKKK